MNEATLNMGDNERRQAKYLSRQRAHPPVHVPGYEGEQFLGKGAFGEVWLAQDSNTGRKVALKFYSHRGGLDWSLLSREVEKLRFLFNDRHVVQLLEVGWDTDPPYYVMEYLERGSLEDLLKAGPLPVREAVTMIRDIAIGLIHAHGKGILHCDLKPANILLDQDGKPRLADFGQSRLSHEQYPALGTLFYMAPEQADMKAAPDVRWDVYALGAVFFQLLTGHPPHRVRQGATELLQSGTLEERLDRYRRLILESPRPSEHRKVPGVNRQLADIIDRCLAPNPRERFANVQAFLDALDAWSARLARRPLVILGALGPALVLLVSALFAWRALNMTVSDSKEALTTRALESDFFAARFVADQLALDIDKRWRILEHEADDAEFRKQLDRIRALPVGSPEYRKVQRQLQGWADARFQHYQRQFKPGTQARSWLVTDRRGVMVARGPFSKKTVNKNLASRDYFHGQGLELPDGARPEPIHKPYRTIVFRSRATKTLMVGFSVPVWAPSAGGKERKAPDVANVIGVLCMTVELGSFLEFTGSKDQFAVLIDLRQDAENQRPGLIVEHPFFDQQQARAHASYYVSEEVLARALPLEQARLRELLAHYRNRPRPGDNQQEFTRERMEEHDFRGDYPDPVPGYTDDSWLATMEPVILARGAERIWDIGFAVVVQERYDLAMNPVSRLETHLLDLGLVALAIVVVVVTGLWGFVILVLNGSAGARLVAHLRRWAGLPGGTSLLQGSSSSVSAPSSIPAGADAVTELVEKQERSP